MTVPAPRIWLWPLVAATGLAALLAVSVVVFWDDLQRTALDPKTPFQTHRPPPAPDYADRAGWALMPVRPQAPSDAEPAADVFFVGPTVYDGGADWNAPTNDAKADRLFRRVMAPNYAGPFVDVGRIFAPRYRQASLYSLLTLREDAREARRFAYDDVARAFEAYVATDNQGRPVFVVGVEQGGTLAARVVREALARQPALRHRLVAVYLIETITPITDTGIPACANPEQTGCLAAWASAPLGREDDAERLVDRALVWNAAADLEHMGAREALCFNPILGAVTEALAPVRRHQGAANATGLEWGARPAFLARQVSAQCVEGVLRVSQPKSAALRPSGSWVERRRAPGYNLFYADLEIDAKRRLAALAKPRP
jgi:Protein of unknown function (DUF3089)